MRQRIMSILRTALKWCPSPRSHFAFGLWSFKADHIVPYPFEDKLVPVMRSIDGVKSFIRQYPGYCLTLYLAGKTKQQWSDSTSRRYMNKVLPGLIYLPVNIPEGQDSFLQDLYEEFKINKKIIAINHTHPHKSSAVIKRILEPENEADIPPDIDLVIKEGIKIVALSVNGPAFFNWFTQKVEPVNGIQKRVVVILGVGGAGQSIARTLAERSSPRVFHLVDTDLEKRNFAADLSRRSGLPVEFYGDVSEIPESGKLGDLRKMDIVFISTIGHDLNEELPESAQEFLKIFGCRKKNIFVDIQPHLELKTVKDAMGHGWEAHPGFGMNSTNDYFMVQKICHIMNIDPPAFNDFEKLVKQDSSRGKSG